jgi:hypothetical protein
MTTESFPDAIHPEAVGSYPALVFGGGGYVWDAVLEYRVWLHPSRGSDTFRPFARHADAERFSAQTRGAEQPLALVLQEEYIDEPAPGDYAHVVGPRITEWPLEFLRRPRRTPRTIADFLAADGPAQRLDILNGDAG